MHISMICDFDMTVNMCYRANLELFEWFVKFRIGVFEHYLRHTLLFIGF